MGGIINPLMRHRAFPSQNRPYALAQLCKLTCFSSLSEKCDFSLFSSFWSMLSLTVWVSPTVWAVLRTYHVVDLHASLTFFFSPWDCWCFYDLPAPKVFCFFFQMLIKLSLPFHLIPFLNYFIKETRNPKKGPWSLLSYLKGAYKSSNINTDLKKKSDPKENNYLTSCELSLAGQLWPGWLTEVCCVVKDLTTVWVCSCRHHRAEHSPHHALTSASLLCIFTSSAGPLSHQLPVCCWLLCFSCGTFLCASRVSNFIGWD